MYWFALFVYVRPILEYNSVVWSPHLIQDITRIEKVQRRFTKRLRCFRNLCYADRLTDLPSLELHRLQLDLTYCYKIVFGLVKLNPADFCRVPLCYKCARGHAYKLYKPIDVVTSAFTLLYVGSRAAVGVSS